MLHFLEALLGSVVTRVRVGVVLPRELAVRLLDLVLARVLRDSKGLVEVFTAAIAGLRRRRDNDPRRPDHAVAEAVALLQHLEHGAFLRVRRLREERLVDVRVEAAVRLDLRETLARQSIAQGPLHQTNALFELRLLVLFRGRERALEIVEHGQELLDEPLVGARDQALLIARDPLAVVLELGRDPLEVVQVLVTLGLERRHLSPRA